VQTFGHLEYILKHSRYSDYLEEEENPISLCSLNKHSLSLVMQVISQVVDLIEAENIFALHLGADEVFNLGSCRKCKLFASQAGHN